MSSLIGQTINNRYRLDALLGDGGMGTVFRALDRNLERQVAIKLMHEHFARQPEFRLRLIQEAQTAAKLDHPSIVRIYDFGDSDQGLFIAMEYVDGGSLRDHLQRLQTLGKFLPFSQSLQIGIQIAEALDYAHRRGVVHRDVKPGNIILKRLSHPDEEGEQPFRALLTDFGLVKLQEGSPMTQSGATVGTPAYMSPEQCEGNELDGRSDLYSLGIVLYEIVTNRLPFSFQSLADAISTHRRGTRPSPPSEYRADAPPLIDSLLAKALAKSPDDRFADGFEMASALRSALLSLEGAVTRVMMRQELDILDRVPDPPDGYELQINAPGHEPSVMALTHSVITVGRNADNDVVLPAEGVSRHHARLQATSLGWEVLDLGGVNGTWIDDRRLRSEDAVPLPVGSTVRVGPYELILRGPEISVTALAGAAGAAGVILGETTRGLEQVAVPANQAPLGIFAMQDSVDVTPGSENEIKVEVVNRSDRDDRVGLRIQGVPAHWITAQSGFVSVPAGETVELTAVIKPPLEQDIPTGRQRLLLDLVSQQNPDANASTTMNLVVTPFFAFDSSLEPQRVQLPGTVTVSVSNTGNARGTFSIVPRDSQGALEFAGESGSIPLQPNQVARVNLDVRARETSWFGGEEVYPYEVNVVSRSGGHQNLEAEAQSGSMVPVWLLYALIFVCTLACAALAIAAVFNRDRLFGQTSTPTVSVAGIMATQTSAAMTQTAEFLPGPGTAVATVDTTPIAPTGMTIDSSSGLISWIPASAGTYVVTVVASNSAGSDSQSFIITVFEPPPQSASIIATPVTDGLVSRRTAGFGNAYPCLDYDCRKSVTTSKRLQFAAQNGQAPVITSTPVTTGVVGVPYSYDVDATGNPVPTYSLSTAPPATADAITQATATSAAATAAAQGDSDGDGLSNAQEELIRTDPFNPDTDADQLTDGQEVLIYATDPLRADTDLDGFSDGQEVLVLGSDPLDPFDPVGTEPKPPGPMTPGPKPPGPMTPGPKPPGPPTRTPGPPPGPPTRTPGPPPASPTFTPPPPITMTPSATMKPPDTPTATFTPEPPPDTPTPTMTASPTATVTPNPPPGGDASVVCAGPPTIDGFFDPSTWPSTPFARFSAPTNPARQVEVYFVKNAGNLYLAYLMNDPVNDSSDQLRVFFDTLGNQGDPDASDRFLMVSRDGSWEVWAGIGSNSDNQLWDSTFSSGNWTVATGDTGSQWVAEIQILAASAMPGLTDPFGMMSQVQFTSALATWPTGADGNNAGTWQAVSNPNCS